MNESKTWIKFKEIAQKIDHGTLLVTIRAGCPQTFASIGKKQLILSPSSEAQPLLSSDTNVLCVGLGHDDDESHYCRR